MNSVMALFVWSCVSGTAYFGMAVLIRLSRAKVMMERSLSRLVRRSIRDGLLVIMLVFLVGSVLNRVS
jgi:hypothetical protein